LIDRLAVFPLRAVARRTVEVIDEGQRRIIGRALLANQLLAQQTELRGFGIERTLNTNATASVRPTVAAKARLRCVARRL